MSKRDRQLKQQLEELFSSGQVPEAIETAAQPAQPAEVEAPLETAATTLPSDLGYLKTVLDHIPLPVYIKDHEHRWAAANFAFGQMIGQPASTLIGHSDKEQSDEEWQQDDQVLESGQPDDSQTSTTLPDGSLQTRRVRRMPLFNAQHKTEFVMGVIQETTMPAHLSEQTQPLPNVEEAQLTSAFDHTGIGMALVATDGHLLRVNPAWCDLLGYTQAEMLSMRLRDITHPDDLESSVASLRKALAGEISTFQAEKRYLHKNGKIVWVELYVSIVRDAQNQPLYFVSQIEDIAQRKQTEQELLKFKFGIERSTAAVFITDINGKILYTNPAFETVYGYTNAEAVGQTPRILKSGYVSAEGYKRFWDTLLSKNTVTGEIVNKTKDGRLIPIDGSNNPILDGSGSLIGFLAIHQDIAQRKQTEEALAKHAAELEESMTFLDTVLENLPVGLFVKDAQDLRFVRWNRGNEELIGLKREDVIGKTDFDFFPPEEAAFFTAKDREVLTSGQLVDVAEEPIDTRHRGRRLLHTRKVPVYAADGTPRYLLGISEDITERRRTEAALQQSAQMLQTIAETVPDLIYIKNSHSEFLMANQSLAQLIGANSPAELLGKSDFDFFPRELAEKYYADEQTIIRSGQPVLGTEEKTVDPDGRERWLSTTKVPFRAPDGSIEGIVGVGRDITERKRSEADILKRSKQLQTAAEVSKAASTILAIDDLLPLTVNLIRQRFDLYYVGLFLVDETRKNAVLRAGTGEAGRTMLERGHQLSIDEHSMIGWCVSNRKARIALDVGQEAVRFNNPLLPETRSELALPLISRGQVLGAMTVQSQQVAAFNQQDITVLQTLADQVANAIANAQLLEQTRVARSEAETRLREVQFLQRVGQQASESLDLSRTLDVIFQALEEDMGFTHIAISLIDRAAGVVTIVRAVGTAAGMQGLTRPIEQLQNDILMDIARKGQIEVIDGWDDRFDRTIWEREGHAALVRAYVPLLLLGEAIGVLEVGYRRVERARITPDEVRLLSGVAGQIAIAVANARLYEQTQRDAERERTINRIAARIRNAQSVEQVLAIAAQELRAATQAAVSVAEIAPVEQAPAHSGNGGSSRSEA